MLSFELKTPSVSQFPEELEIYCDAIGLENLLAQLTLLKSRKTEHIQLMAGSWGGHLDEAPQRMGNVPLRHIKILLRT